MFVKESGGKCRVVRSFSSNGELVYCLKPAQVVVSFTMPDGKPVVICPGCARELAKELVDSVRGGRLDVDVLSPIRKGRR
jgi:hypothetical protein